MLVAIKVFSRGGLGDLLAVRPFASGNLKCKGANARLRKIAADRQLGGVHWRLCRSRPRTRSCTSTVDSEITSLNSLFTEEAALAGVSSNDITTGALAVFDTITSGDVATVEANTTFDDLLYGFNPANLTSDPGAYDAFNGALGEFDDAYNVLLYAAENGGNLVPVSDIGTDLISTGATTAALGTDTVTGAVTTFLDAGWADLLGYF